MKVAQENVAEVNEEVEHIQVIDINTVNQEVRQENVVNQDIEVDQGVVIVPENEVIEVKALEGIEENIVKVEAQNDMTDVNIQAEEVNVDVLEIGTYQHF